MLAGKPKNGMLKILILIVLAGLNVALIRIIGAWPAAIGKIILPAVRSSIIWSSTSGRSTPFLDRRQDALK